MKLKMLKSLALSVVFAFVSCVHVGSMNNIPANKYNPMQTFESVVKISVNLKGKNSEALSGSGFAIDNNYIVSAGHVCTGILVYQDQGLLANDIILTYYNSKFKEEQIHKAQIIDIDIMNDICLLYSKKHGLTPLKFAYKETQIYDTVYIIGAPLGVLGSVSEGKVMALDKDFGAFAKGKTVVSAAAAPGNSGSPVLNDMGHIIGILVMGHGEYDHLSIITTKEKVLRFLRKHDK